MKTPEQAIASLLRQGAMLQPTLGGVPILATIVREIGTGRWFWWAAGGETEFDGHVIQADAVKVWHDGAGVEFLRGGEFAGYLTSIEDALEDDAVSERVRRELEDWKKQYDADERLRGFIEREARARGGNSE